MGKLSKINFVVVVIVVLLIAVLSEVIFSFNDTEYTVTITGKDRITESSKDSDGNSHQNTLCLLMMKTEILLYLRIQTVLSV